MLSFSDALVAVVVAAVGISKSPRSPNTPPSRSNRLLAFARQRTSPLPPVRRHVGREVHHFKRRSETDSKGNVVRPDISKELTFPAIAVQKSLSLLEFVEKRGLTITDEELITVVQDAFELDRAMEKIFNKKEKMKSQMQEMGDKEFQRIKRIHARMPRHMQDVLKFEGRTVHVQERSAMPPMPFAGSSYMPLKYGHSMPHHMGMPPPGYAPPFAPPPMGMPPPPLGMPPPGMGGHYGVPPPMSLLGPPPFGVPMVPPPINNSVIQPPPPIQSASHSLIGRTEVEKRPAPPHGLNPLAFNTSTSMMPPAIGDYNMPPPIKKPNLQTQNPAMNRISNNLSNMLTNALKAQVSKSQVSFGTSSPTTTPTKKPVPSLMSINIPGVPKAGPSGSQK
uniref:Zinc finger protein n=1 Tax=Caenorhabditis tropicalis TaxID=1561998 RepID=A0A1I7U3X8_9PELO